MSAPRLFPEPSAGVFELAHGLAPLAEGGTLGADHVARLLRNLGFLAQQARTMERLHGRDDVQARRLLAIVAVLERVRSGCEVTPQDIRLLRGLLEDAAMALSELEARADSYAEPTWPVPVPRRAA